MNKFYLSLTVLIAFVAASGAVSAFLPMDASVSELQAATADLGRGSAS